MGKFAGLLSRMMSSGPSRRTLEAVGAGEKGEKASVTQSVFTMANAVLGAGVLGYPFCFKVCGLGLATLLVLVTLSASELSMRLLVAASQITGKRSYEDLAGHCFGRMGRSTVDISVGAMNLGSLVAYLNILADMFSLVANTVIPPGAEPSRNMLLSAITLGAVLPVALFVRSPRLLSNVSQASVAFIFFFSLMIALMALSPAQLPGGHVAMWEPSGLLVAFPVVTYGFTAHQVLFSIYSSLASASVTRIMSVIQQSLILSTLVYLVVGAGGYIAFGARTAGDVLRNFGGTASAGLRLAFERTLKIGYGISILGTVPLIVLPLLPAFASVLGLKIEPGSAYANPVHEHLVTVLVIGTALALAVLVPNIEYIFGLMGATVSVAISFILPAAIYLRTTGMQQQGHAARPAGPTPGTGPAPVARPAPWRQRRRTAGLLLAFGLLAGMACTARLLAAVAEENEVVQLAHELLREETKVLKAAEAEAKVKRVVEAVGAVAEAQRQLNEAQEETAATLGAALQATQELHATGSQHPHKNKGAVQKLKEVKGKVDAAVQKLESTTARLAATTSRLRNDTAGGSGVGAAAAGNGTAAVGVLSEVGPGGGMLADAVGGRHQEQQRRQQEKQQQEQEQQQGGAAAEGATKGASSSGGGSGGGSGGSRERDTGGAAAGSGAVAAAAAGGGEAVDGTKQQQQQQQQQQQGGAAAESDDVASMLEKVVVESNTTLSSVKQSQEALAAVHTVKAGSLHKKKEEIMSVLRHVVNVTTEAAAQVNATVERLKKVEADKASELVGVATELLREHEEEEARRQRAAELDELEQLREGRKVTPGTGSGKGGQDEEGGGSREKGEAAAAEEHGGRQEGGGPTGEKQKAREKLKLVTSGVGTNGSASINVTEVAQAAADIAASASQVAKASLEQAIESNTAEVASRAIEIAKELVKAKAEGQSLRKAEGGSSSASGEGKAAPTAAGAATAGSGGSKEAEAAQAGAVSQQ